MLSAVSLTGMTASLFSSSETGVAFFSEINDLDFSCLFFLNLPVCSSLLFEENIWLLVLFILGGLLYFPSVVLISFSGLLLVAFITRSVADCCLTSCSAVSFVSWSLLFSSLTELLLFEFLIKALAGFVPVSNFVESLCCNRITDVPKISTPSKRNNPFLYFGFSQKATGRLFSFLAIIFSQICAGTSGL